MQVEIDDKNSESYFIVIQPLYNTLDQNIFMQKIIPLEGYRKYQSGNFLSLHFSKQCCFTLEYLYQGIISNYYQIDQLTLLIISSNILNHYLQLKLAGLNHGELNMKNIIIQLSQDNHLKRTSERFDVEKVYFIRYKLTNTSQDEMSLLSIICVLLQFDALKKLTIDSIRNEISEQINEIKDAEKGIWNYAISWMKTGIKFIISVPYGKQCDEALELIALKFEEQLKIKQFQHPLQIQRKFISNILQYYKEKQIQNAKIKRMQEIGQWLNKQFQFFRWEFSESENLIHDGIKKVQFLIQKLNLNGLDQLYDDQLRQIHNQYKLVFNFDVKLDKQKFFEHYLCQILSKIDDQDILNLNFKNIFQDTLQKEYLEMLKIEILKLVNDLI